MLKAAVTFMLATPIWLATSAAPLPGEHLAIYAAELAGAAFAAGLFNRRVIRPLLRTFVLVHRMFTRMFPEGGPDIIERIERIETRQEAIARHAEERTSDSPHR